MLLFEELKSLYQPDTINIARQVFTKNHSDAKEFIGYYRSNKYKQDLNLLSTTYQNFLAEFFDDKTSNALLESIGTDKLYGIEIYQVIRKHLSEADKAIFASNFELLFASTENKNEHLPNYLHQLGQALSAHEDKTVVQKKIRLLCQLLQSSFSKKLAFEKKQAQLRIELINQWKIALDDAIRRALYELKKCLFTNDTLYKFYNDFLLEPEVLTDSHHFDSVHQKLLEKYYPKGIPAEREGDFLRFDKLREKHMANCAKLAAYKNRPCSEQVDQLYADIQDFNAAENPKNQSHCLVKHTYDHYLKKYSPPSTWTLFKHSRQQSSDILKSFSEELLNPDSTLKLKDLQMIVCFYYLAIRGTTLTYKSRLRRELEEWLCKSLGNDETKLEALRAKRYQKSSLYGKFDPVYEEIIKPFMNKTLKESFGATAALNADKLSKLAESINNTETSFTYKSARAAKFKGLNSHIDRSFKNMKDILVTPRL